MYHIVSLKPLKFVQKQARLLTALFDKKIGVVQKIITFAKIQ